MCIENKFVEEFYILAFTLNDILLRTQKNKTATIMHEHCIRLYIETKFKTMCFTKFVSYIQYKKLFTKIKFGFLFGLCRRLANIQIQILSKTVYFQQQNSAQSINKCMKFSLY